MKISLLLPYWDRQEAADKALASIRKNYSDLNLEIIVIDDGNPVPFKGEGVKIIRLPEKQEPKSPITCWNIAAKEATGDVLVISCIEVIHETPILRELTENLGKDDYRVAAAWCPDGNRWHTHSTIHVPDCPNGTGIGFCAALTPELYWRAGGFCEDYREGAGYEDRDWIKRLLSVGAKIEVRDDLAVIHPKSGASIAWGREKFRHNLELYRQKWDAKDVVTFVCLNAGNYLGMGSLYVNNLAEGVRKNMPDGVNWRFVCLTDDPRGLVNGIEIIPLPKDVKGWWGKLYLFRKGLFPDGQRIVFLDLDTIITGDLSKIIRYDGDMAILKDFYFPQRGAPGVILFRSGFGHRIWDEWVSEGRPEHEMGDLWWIERLDKGKFTKTLDRLQDKFPGDFVSYKVSCKEAVPQGAKVVCFHGNPRPHHYPSPWVRELWQSGEVESKHAAFGAVQSLIDSDRYQDALVLINEQLDSDPGNLSALFQFGEILLKSDKIGLALNIYKYLTTLTNRAEVWNNLGRCYQKRETANEARKCFAKALSLDPNSAAAIINLGVMDVNEGNPERAKVLATKALKITPNSRQAIDVLSMAKFQLRDWSAWDDHIHAEGPPFRVLRQYKVPSEQEWMGEPDKTVVIYREQGLGDEILYASCVQESIDLSRKVILDVDKRLVGLFKRSFPKADVYGTGHSSDITWAKEYAIDASAPIGRIPGFFRRSDASFTGEPYLKACELRKTAFRAMLDSLGPGKKVGLAWTGGKRTNSTVRSDSDYRSLTLDDMKALMLPGHHYISLEYKPGERAEGIHEFPWITQSQDYDDTAALVDELDYIIAVPTTVVHLAGALGKTCYCLTPEFPNWRFGLSGEMLWHKSVKLFRGNKRVNQLKEHLEETTWHLQRIQN